MRRTAAALAILVLTSPFARAQALNDTPDPAPQTRTTVPAQPDSPDDSYGIFREPSFIRKGVDLFDRRANGSRTPKDGFFVDFGNMITGAGWISAGPGYRKLLFNENAVASASAAVSWRLYRMAQASIEFPRLGADHITLGAQNMFRDAVAVNYYGLGNDSLLANRSGYRLQTNDASVYASVSARALSLKIRGGWLEPVTVLSMERKTTYPNTLAVFSEQNTPGLTGRPRFLRGDLTLSVDTRDSVGHATRGGFYQATWSVYADQSTGRNNFQRYEADASHYIPVGSDNWILALHAAAALSSTTAGHEVPFYLMPNLGGRNDRGFADYRFTDRNMQTYTVESRWRVFSHLDAAAFVDGGSVASTIRGLKASDLKPSYGVGIRLHNYRTTMARVDFGHSVEGWHIYFRMNEPFRRSTQSNGWRTPAPYVP
jgi:hypothetical protein